MLKKPQVLQVSTLENNKLFAGTKQECMNFIKENKLSRANIKIEPLLNTTVPSTDTSTPTSTSTSNTSRLTQTTTASWYKRVFKNERL